MFRYSIDRWVAEVLRVIAFSACALVALIVLFLLLDSLPALRAVGTRFVTDDSWHPDRTASGGTFGILPIVAGTLAVTLGAVLLAAPVGVASAIFSQFYAPRPLAIAYRWLVELLAGIPSVVYGFWGLVVLTPWIARFEPPGQSLLAGILIVSLMIVPTIMLVVESALAAVPESYLAGAAALGMRRWGIVRRIAIPSARGGIVTGVVLGAARAVGETMAVVMVCGNVVNVPTSLFSPVRTLTANIVLEMGYALDVHRSALFTSALILLLICIALVFVVDRVEGRGRLSTAGPAS